MDTAGLLRRLRSAATGTVVRGGRGGAEGAAVGSWAERARWRVGGMRRAGEFHFVRRVVFVCVARGRGGEEAAGRFVEIGGIKVGSALLLRRERGGSGLCEVRRWAVATASAASRATCEKRA